MNPFKIEPRTNAELLRKALDAFGELNDLKEGTEPGHMGIIGRPLSVAINGTLHDGRYVVEQYEMVDGELFVLSGGLRYRVLEGDYYSGRKRRYAAFLAQRLR